MSKAPRIVPGKSKLSTSCGAAGELRSWQGCRGWAHPRMGCKGYPLHSLGLSCSPFPSAPREKNCLFPVVSQSKAPPTVRSRACLKLRCQGNHRSVLPCWWWRPSGRDLGDSVSPMRSRRLPLPHPGDAFFTAQGGQHLGHVAHHARVLHTHHAPLAPQLHGDRDPRSRVGRPRCHPCPSGPDRRCQFLPALPEASCQWFREGIVPASLVALGSARLEGLGEQTPKGEPCGFGVKDHPVPNFLFKTEEFARGAGQGPVSPTNPRGTRRIAGSRRMTVANENPRAEPRFLANEQTGGSQGPSRPSFSQ